MVKFVRVLLPAVLMVFGIVWAVAGGLHESSLEIGVPIFSAGASIWFVNFLLRVMISGDRDRDVEEDARAYFASHGHWPDERGAGEARR